ncbi:NTP transferase domain-containing protein [Cellulomonas sp.]|uniref:molybdenum cofactor guanylyltransferase n=1 Tax=Cellulomonas sp. TaxID=40001 RepID=UPI0025877D5F|nr:NTP transferase domain-containing protein [Cellulomonas sp.]MCR6688468.1 NTP transferase domain-containing protein [Cellulomonas sp.]
MTAPDDPAPDDRAPDERGHDEPVFDAVVLAGGAGRRLEGAVKPELVLGGRALVDHALDAVSRARRRVLVAPPALARPGVPTTLEDPPLGGPVAGIAAGLALLVAPPANVAGVPGPAGAARAADVVVVLACDVPRAGSVVPALVAAASAPGTDGARLVDAEGAPQHLVAAYRTDALRTALASLGEVRGASVRRLVAGLHLRDVPDPGGAGEDVDTWADAARVGAALTGAGGPTGEPAAGPSAPTADAVRDTIGPERPRQPGSPS